jgi:hypothetical protein
MEIGWSEIPPHVYGLGEAALWSLPSENGEFHVVACQTQRIGNKKQIKVYRSLILYSETYKSSGIQVAQVFF